MDRDAKPFLMLLMLVSSLIASGGQLLFKTGISSSGLAMAALVFAGIVAYGISTLAYLYTLSRRHLSWTYSFVGLSYVFTVVLSYFVLNENVGIFRMAGVAAIMVGTLFIGLS